MNNPYIPPESENEKIARRLIDMGVFDCSEEDELKNTQIYYLQDWLINALDERIDYLSKRLQEESQKRRELENNLHTTEQKLFEVFFDKETVNA